MSTTIIDPPTGVTDITDLQQSNVPVSLHFYLSYDYLPAKNFSLLLQNVNDLYEFVFEVINGRPANEDELLVIEEIRTGNSIDVLLETLGKVKPARSVWITFSIVVALITGHREFRDGQQRKADTELTKAHTIEAIQNAALTEAERELKKEQTEKFRLENEKTRLENELATKGLSKDERDKILLQENLDRINKSLIALKKQISAKPMKTVNFNNSQIYNNGDLDF